MRDGALSTAALRARIEWLLLFRVLFATVLLGSAIIVNVNNVASFTDGRYLALSGLIVATYLASVGFGILLRRLQRLEPLIYAQLLLDVALISGVVAVTGGLESIFVFLFFLVVFNGANLQQQRGAFVAAAMAAISFLLLGIVQFAGEPVAALSWLQATTSDVRLPIYNITVHVFAFFIVAFLSGYLAEKLGTADAALREREQDVASLRVLNEEIVRSVRSGLLTVGTDGRVTLANRAASRIFGLRRNQLVGADLQGVLPGIAERLEGVGEHALDLAFTREDGGARMLSAYTIPLAGPQGRPLGRLISVQDVTELRRLEEQVRRQAQLAAVGELAASIAHEIRNPLAAISGAVELLRGQEETDPRDARLKRIVLREVDRLNRLVEDFLAYARPREPVLRPVPIEALVEDVLEAARIADASGEQALLVFEDHRPSADRGPVSLDADLIRQVLWNLIRNAAESAGPGGAVNVQLRTATLTGAVPGVEVVVMDDGPGISEAALARLFEPFFTTRTKGTGLGLATSLRFALAHGGLLEGENAPSGGARFRLVLPLSPVLAAPREESATAAEPRTGEHAPSAPLAPAPESADAEGEVAARRPLQAALDGAP